MSEPSPQSAAAPKKAWYLKWWVWLIAAFLVAGGISAIVNPNGDSDQLAVAQPTRTAPAEPVESETPTPAGEVIYEANEAINAFVLAFNDTHPAEALTASDLTKRSNGQRATAQIAGVEVSISDDASSEGPYGISVYWDNPEPGTADGNLAMFRTLMKVVAPNLSEAAIDARWQEVLDHPINRPEWADGIEVVPGPTAINNAPGTFGYVKLYG